MTPYYQDSAVTIYHGDCREILPLLSTHETIITDPVWPNASVRLFGHDDPSAMMRAMWGSLAVVPQRAAIHLGCDSDPRFLLTTPETLPFFRVAWLEIVRMGYKGRLGMTGDVGYLFGTPPASRPGSHIIPGRCTDADPKGRQSRHPCPRKLKHVQWLVRWWSDLNDMILDPFAGSCTTALAAKGLNRKCVCIEIEERFCEMGARRLSQEVLL